MRQPTLTRHLLAWTLGALLLVWGSFIALGYRTGQHEADELTDGHLASVAALMLAYGGGEFQHGTGPRPALAPALKAHDYQQSLSVVLWDRTGAVLTHSGAAPVPAFQPGEGFDTVSLGQPLRPWRAFSRWDTAQGRKVMVLLSVQERDELARDIAEQMTEPGLWLLPVVALALGLAVRRGLKPLYELSRAVHALDIHSPAPLEARSRHEELRATVTAINTLMERYHAALTRERALANEFAHELRTPLAAVALHARALKAMPPGAERDQTLARLDHDALRAGQVLTHLLGLARASRAQWDEAAQPLDLAQLARGVVAGFAQAAHESGHELALACDGPFELTGHALLLELALRNLVENALEHTPPGTHVEVQLDARSRWLQVQDEGGRAQAMSREPAAPAMRSLGLGLGLRVVEKIAVIHGATFGLVPRTQGHGSCYRISFAPDPPAHA